jgi:hypothetical protein
VSDFVGSEDEGVGSGASGAGVPASVLVVSAGALGGGGGASWARAGNPYASTNEAVAKKATPNRLTPTNRFLPAANGVSSR